MALEKTRSMVVTAAVLTPVGVCDVTDGASKPLGKSNAAVTEVALEELSTKARAHAATGKRRPDFHID